MQLKSVVLAMFLGLSQFSVSASSLNDYEKAYISYNQANYDEAFIHLKNSLKQDPNNLAAKILMGQILLINGYLSAAEVEFYEALDNGADINIIAEPLGNTLLFQNKYNDILDLDYTDKLTNENKIKWLQIRASACVRLNKIECAEKAYKDSLAIKPDHILSFNGLASLALFNKNLDLANKYINQAMAISTTESTTWRQKGLLAQAKGNLDEAIKYLQQSLKFKKDDPVTLRKLADIYLESDDFDSARIFVNEIIEKTPDDPLAILLSSWLESKNKSKLISNDRLEKLNQIMSNLGPDVIASQPELLYISGLTAFFHGNTEQATRDFAKYLLKNPDDMQAVMLLSRTYLATQQDKQALLLLEKHQDKLMGKIDSALLLGELFIKSNRAFKAQSLLDELEKIYGNEPRLQLFKIKLMIVRGKQEQALKILDENLKKNLNNPTFLVAYSMLKLQAGKQEDAFETAEILLKLYPNDPNFLNLKAGILIRLNRLDDAIDVIETTLKIEPTLFPAKFNLASIYSRKGNINDSNILVENLLESSPRHPQVLMLKAHNLVLTDKLTEAINIYSDVILLNPREQYAKSQLAKLHMRLGNYDDALYQLDRLLIDNFDNADYQLQKAQILLKLKKYRELEDILKRITLFNDLSSDSLIQVSQLQRAINDLSGAIMSLSKAEKLAPNNSFITLDKIKLLLSSEDFAQAENILKSMESSNLKNPNYWYVKALYENSQNNDIKVMENLQRSLELDANFHQALILLYEMSLAGNKKSIFITNTQQIIRNNPNNLLAKNLLAQFFYIQQDFTQAEALYSELLLLDNVLNKAEIYNKMAIMTIDSNLEQSALYIKKAFDLEENDARILDTFGWILSLQGRYEEGLGMLRKAFVRDSNNPEIRYHLGFSLIKLGRPDEAKKELALAVEAQRPFYNRDKAQVLLDGIK